MLETLTLPAVNRLLRSNSWAQERLRAHAGKTVLVTCPPGRFKATITSDGLMAAASPEIEADTTIVATPGVLMRFAARDETAWRDIEIQGDVDLAATLDYLSRNIRWDYEETLSKVFGDVAAHRIGGALRELDRWGRSTAANLAHATAEYAVHENPTIVGPQELDAFSRDVDTIRDDAARLEKRVQLITRRLMERS